MSADAPDTDESDRGQYLRVSRSGPPQWNISAPGRRASAPAYDAYDWDWAIAWPFAVLASPLTLERMPAKPREIQPGPDSGALGYWNALSYFLTYSLGWSRHDRGLRWWYENDRPVDDFRLALISHVWEADGTLERYAEWATSRPAHVPPDFRNLMTQPNGLALADDVSREWESRLNQIREANTVGGSTGEAHPYGLHLEMGSHIEHAVEETATAPTLLRKTGEPNSFVLIAESMVGWYRSLDRACRTLERSNGHSPRVDVFARTAGYLGTYRRSWETGLWFSGQHRFHSVGN